MTEKHAKKYKPTKGHQKTATIMSISVPVELRKDIIAYNKKQSVNWSAIAADAFQRFLDKQGTKNEKKKEKGSSFHTT